MNRLINDPDALLSSIFSDGTEAFRSPSEPKSGDCVAVRLRLMKDTEARVTLLQGFPGEQVHMSMYRTDGAFDWYEAKLYCGQKTIFYSFLIECQGRSIHFDRLGARWVDSAPEPDPAACFRVIPGFHVPKWAKGAVQYQIFPDRFRDGNPHSDIWNGEYWYAGGPIRHAKSWDALPEQDDFRCLYGGDLVGVREKLDYLQALGVEVIYFNPIFVSPSGHKYDTQDYRHIDPHLTVIPKDGGRVLPPGSRNNAKATRYIQRTTDPENLRASDEWFAGFCDEVHRRGMRIILDGVFNHCGSFNRWMDREGVYGGDKGAFANPESPWRDYFDFDEDGKYRCWWDVDTLPKLCYEQSLALCEDIFAVAEKWVLPPYRVDAWRLDVAADLGPNRAFNHLFWKVFRQRVKAVNPGALIIAEHYGDPSEWLGGDEWDSVMNYDAFMDPLSFFLTGMDKHSDYRRDDLYQNGAAFFDDMLKAMARMPTASVYCAMDELSNHDHSRFMTRTNGRVGRLHTAGSAAAGEGIRPEVFREAVLIQMTWPGAPTIYYGDEAGLVGWTDPDNRRTYPWGREDRSLIDYHAALTGLRRKLPVLRCGSVKPLCAGHGCIAYARFDGETALAVACNNTDSAMTIELPLRDIGIPDGTEMVCRFITTEQGFSQAPERIGRVEGGVLRWEAPAHSAAILLPAT